MKTGRYDTPLAILFTLIILFTIPPINHPGISIIGSHFIGFPFHFLVTHGVARNMMLIKFLPLTLIFNFIIILFAFLGIFKICRR